MSIDFKTEELIRTRTISAQIDGLSLDYSDQVEESVLMQGSPQMKRAASVVSYRANCWELCLEQAVKAIVSLKITEIKSFDTSCSGVYNASGFVVDKELGIIVTNRHVISSGPVVVTATFNDYEEVELHVLYIDPIHDFGFLKFNPTDVCYMDVVQLELHPELAKIGTEIRVVGNDSGEHLSIQHGIVSRLDREAPPYGLGNYNDFNTFYLQACSGTSNGSSGSPVLDYKGHAVALNAGASTNGNQSFYFPLYRVQRALSLLRDGKEVQRGSLMCDFIYTTFNNAHHLGLTEEVETMYRKHKGIRGVFTVSNVIRGGTSEGRLQTADIVVTLNGKLMVDFVALEDVLDSSVGNYVELVLLRETILATETVQVADLHSLACPSEFVEIGDAVIHQLSYYNARSFNIPIGGCFVSNPGLIFGQNGVTQKFILLSVGATNVENVDSLINQLCQNKVSKSIQFSYKYLGSSFVHVGAINVDMIDSFRVFLKQGVTWNSQDFNLTKDVDQSALQNGTNFVQLQTGNGAVNDAARVVVYVQSFLPLMVDGCKYAQNEGVGIVLDAVKGVVATTRSAVPSQLCNVKLVFVNSCSGDGHVLFVHPIYNLVLLKYDVKLVDSKRLLRGALLDQNVPRKADTYLVALKTDGYRLFRRTGVSTIEEPDCVAPSPAKFVPVNVEHTTLDSGIRDTIGGVLLQQHGQVQGLWCVERDGQSYAVPSIYINNCLQLVMKETQLQLFPAVVQPVPLSTVSQYGLGAVWMQRLTKSSPERHTVLQVQHAYKCDASLQDGDILLHVNGYLLTRCLDLELLQVELSQKEITSLRVLVLRNGKEIEIHPRTKQVRLVNNSNTYVCWSGCIVQQAMEYISEQSSVQGLPFVSNVMVGSPAQTAGLNGGCYVQSIGTVTLTDNLEACFQEIAKLKGRQRVVLVSQSGIKKIVSILPDQVFWPTYMLKTSINGTIRIKL